MADIGISVGAKIAEYLVEPARRQCVYLFYYKSNMKNLKTQVDKLEDMRCGVQLLVDAARRNLDVVGPAVDAWMRQVDEIKADVQRFTEHRDTVESGCLDPKSRYSLSRKAVKMTADVLTTQADGNFNRFFYPARPVLPIRSTFFKVFESRVWTMKEIMEALKGDDIYMIGICGMAGVGKTTMVKEVAVRAVEKNLFNEVAMAVVSQNPDFGKIQDELANMLGLKFEDESLSGRACRLWQRLSSEKEKSQKTLVILDDVWANLDLEAIGIPLGGDNKNCKIVLTSRNQDVCTEIGTQTIFRINVLPKLEAWSFFKEIAGVDSPDLHPTAVQVAKECGGLPIAIVTVGRVLKDKSKKLWNDALSQLKKSIPTSITGVQAYVYQSIQLSYNHLASEEAKSIFLLCCLFPEDYEILLEDLVRYGMGLRLFEGVDVLEEGRDRVHTLVDKLRNCFLLLDSGKTDSVKMHDVVRDVGKSIASKDQHVFMVIHDSKLKMWPRKDTYEQYTAISIRSDEIRELPHGLNSPRLEVLLLECKYHLLKTPDNLFEGMRGLKVLELQAMFIRVLPSSLAFLTLLQTLCLRNCNLEDISVIGKLEKLEILSFYGSLIKKLPEEMCKLMNLRLLDLTGCRGLETIAPGVISGLVRLEELYMRTSLRQWKSEEGKERSNASLVELESLPHLNEFHWISSHQ